MIDWFYQLQLWVAVAAGLVALIFGLIGRIPSGFTVALSAVVELGLVIQLAVSISMVFLGFVAKQDTVEFFAYLIVALMVPVGAVFWALIERGRWSTVVLGVGSLTVAVMLVRMWQIWTGSQI